jgi:hypothetical protein
MFSVNADVSWRKVASATLMFEHVALAHAHASRFSHHIALPAEAAAICSAWSNSLLCLTKRRTACGRRLAPRS